MAEIARHRGIPAAALPTRNTGLAEVRALRRALIASGSQVIIADRPRDLRLAAMAALGRRIALVYRYNVSRPRPPSDLVTRLAYSRLAATVFRSRTGAEQVLAAAPFMAHKPYRVITGGVDTAMFYPDPSGGESFRRQHRLGERTMLLAVGALMPEKRYPEMLDIVARLPERAPLVICGEGRMEGELRALASSRNLDVRFLGYLPAPELRNAFAAASVVIHTCQVETFGLSVAEAMACGRPVLVAEGGAMNDVVEEAGIIVRGNDPREFADHLARVLGDSVLRARLGAAAHSRSVTHFSVDRVVAEYERLLLELTAGR